MNPIVVLLGDSVLDNFYWLTNSSQDTAYVLASCGYTVYNWAVDESTVVDVLNGIKPNSIYQAARAYPYPTVAGIVRPLALLETITPDLVVLSIGGNDFRAELSALRWGPDYFLQVILNQSFVANYHELLKRIKSRTSKIILVGIYLPYLGSGSAYAGLSPFQEKLVIHVRQFYQMMARTYDLPLLDLSRTFNPLVRAHYGSTEIEPSNLSTFCLSQCLHHIYHHYAGYKVYYAPECGPQLIIESE